jgi:hypothetical protein
MQDFLKLYATLVEKCFNSCCNDFTSKALSSKEACFALVLVWPYLFYDRTNALPIALKSSLSIPNGLEHVLQRLTQVRDDRIYAFLLGMLYIYML